MKNCYGIVTLRKNLDKQAFIHGNPHRMLFILERIFSLLVISNQELGNKTWLDLVFHKVFNKSEDESTEFSTDSSYST